MDEHPIDQVPAAADGAGTVYGSGVAVGLTPLAHQYLDQTRPWVQFMAVIVFISAGLMVLSGIVMLGISLAAGATAGAGASASPFGAVGGALLGMFYVALSLVYIVPGVYLARYAKAIKLLRTDGGAERIENALKQQRSFWRFVGIVTAICIILVIVGLALAVVIGVLAAGMTGRV